MKWEEVDPSLQVLRENSGLPPALEDKMGNSFDALPEVGRHLLSAEAAGGGGSEVSLFFFHVEMTSAPQHEWAVDS